MGKGVRRSGREYALKMIYSLQVQDSEEKVRNLLGEFWTNFRFNDDVLGEAKDEVQEPVPAEVRRFAEDLVLGVSANLEKIDTIIEEFSTNWALERMARVDLSLLRLTTYELLYRPDVPSNAAINEAIELGKQYGTKETPAFINGILDKISRVHRQKTQ
ncbi:N utilization substance protein B [Desulfuromonas versatilis]|uniref:Transcription antitermination protein NusB n=1 Tax=Desulfuromonas versatilis TaxID=2802975 RepID=A0ABN6DXB9_9BACT|nr:transcription antitermination factor NusB [Desulfuromonas versatilis]BCR04768.1 N utilization substance protein B [Desulfuromonas versatilis]